MLIRDAMTPHAEWITPDLSLIEAARRMRDLGIGCLPVGQDDRLVGIVTDRDLACRAVASGADPKTTRARDVMTTGLKWCFDDETIDEAIQRMEDNRIHHMPVLDRQKRMVGMLSLSDLALKGPAGSFNDLSRLAARDASRAGTARRAH